MDVNSIKANGKLVGRNCIILNRLAHTEDKRLVYNIFFYNVKKRASLMEMKVYFELFGEVKDIKFLPNYYRFKTGYVQFAKAESATSVLTKFRHVTSSKISIGVKASYTWYQPPEGYGCTNKIAETTDTTIQNLNDDCLREICVHLTLKEQISFANTCQQFRNFIKSYSGKNYKIVNLAQLDGLTLWEQREFFCIFALDIVEVLSTSAHLSVAYILDFLAAGKCVNVQRLKFQYGLIPLIKIGRVLKFMTNITTIEFYDSGLKDDVILLLKKLPKLETLVLYGNAELTGKNLEYLKNLQHLCLGDCVNIQSTHMVKALPQLKRLKSLNIQNCEKLTQDAFDSIANNCNKLEILKFTTSNCYYECIARLPNLIYLEVALSENQTGIRQQLFDALAEHKVNQLEYLKVVGRDQINTKRARQLAEFTKLKHIIFCKCIDYGNNCLPIFARLTQLEAIALCHCHGVDNEQALTVLKECKNLKKMVLHGSKDVTNQFVYDAVNIVNERKANNIGGTQPFLELIVSSTDVRPGVVLSPQVVAAKKAELLNVIPTIECELLVHMFGSKDEYNCFEDDSDFFNDECYSDDEYDNYFDDDDDVDYEHMVFAAHDWEDILDDEELDLIFHHAYNHFGDYNDRDDEPGFLAG